MTLEREKQAGRGPDQRAVGDPYDADDDLLEATRHDGATRLRIYRPPAVTVVLGRGSRPEQEVRLTACAADGVRVLRRRGGGCAVVLDPGNVVLSLTLAAEGIGGNRGHFARFSTWLIRALAGLGIDGVDRQGISDLALGQRKVGGACIYRSRGLLLYSATLLAEPRVDLMERYLFHPPREPAYRRQRPHAGFVGHLLPSPEIPDARALCRTLQSRLTLDTLEQIP